MPDNNKVVRYILLSDLHYRPVTRVIHGSMLRTISERGIVMSLLWADEIQEAIRHLWYKNVATQYRRTIHSWRSTGRYPETVSEARWAAWTAVWQDQSWLDRAGKNKTNRYSEPAGPGTGTSKHIAGSKTYSAHYHSMQASQGTDPSSWDLYLQTHRRPDGSFVDERSRLVNQNMEALRDESLTLLDDGTIPDQPSSEEVNSMFKSVVGGRKKERMYGCERAYHLFGMFAGGVASLAVYASSPNDKSGTEIAKLTTKVDETKEEIILLRKQMNEGFQNVLRVKEERVKEKHRNSFLSRIVKFFKRVD